MVSLCINPVYVDGYLIDSYRVGNQYEYKYLYDKCLIGDNWVEFEWSVYISKYNHYQFTKEEFDKYFVDIVYHRDLNIKKILLE